MLELLNQVHDKLKFIGLLLQPALLHFLPAFLLFVIKLAGQSVDGNIVLSAELAPQNEAKIVLSGGVGDGVVYWLRFIRFTLEHHIISTSRKVEGSVAKYVTTSQSTVVGQRA